MADTLRILVATDNHVGVNERDPVRGNDSWKTFHEIMTLAKDRDVDMVLLAGDLFHDNVPTRKSMYNVMRSLRLNCYGDKPCEVEIISDGSEHFDATFGHANYEDPDINVAIPVFSIHGNHDDPSGDGHYAALDILEMAGLINYFGRTPESDNIHVKPVLLQKGSTKVALYGLSNVRDERMYRSFRDEKVHFYQPTTQQDEWYNIACVHQNHHAYTATSYLPENFLPGFLDLVIWGHEHECAIKPRLNPEMDFQVIQPGSSIATSFNQGESITKHVSILSVTGREMKSEPIRLKTVRPFVYKEIALNQDKEAIKIAQKDGHRHKLTEHLQKIVDGLIEEARSEWEKTQAQNSDEEIDESPEIPLPLIRLRVEISPYNGTTRFETENPQRFSNRFTGRVANHNDVIQFHARKRAAAKRDGAMEEVNRELLEKPEFSALKVSQLAQEFLAAQSLTILPQNYFGDAVTQYIDKDDKHAMESFVMEALSKQVGHLVTMHEAEADEDDEVDLAEKINEFRNQLESLFAEGKLKIRSGVKPRFKPKPDNWDDGLDGEWEDQPGALLRPDEVNNEDDNMLDGEDATPAPQTVATKGKGRGARGKGTAKTKAATSTRASKAATTGRGHSKKIVEEDSDEENDVVSMLDNEEDAVDDVADNSDSQAMFFADTPPTRKKLNGSSTAALKSGSRAGSTTSTTRGVTAAPPPKKKPPTRAAATKSRQATLNFSASQASVLGSGTVAARSQSIEIEDDSDDDAFEPVSTARTTRKR